jgi:phosphoribosylformylglycinamidine synthase subunit PurS
LKFRARVEVSLRKDHTDPESETVKRTLLDLNFPVNGVRIRKVYEITVESDTKKDAETSVRAMCTRLLANPTKDEYEFEVEPIGKSSTAAEE